MRSTPMDKFEKIEVYVISPEWSTQAGFLAVRESQNDVTHKFVVSGKLHKEDIKEIKLIKRHVENAQYGSIDIILNWLCKEGKINKGTYKE